MKLIRYTAARATLAWWSWAERSLIANNPLHPDLPGVVSSVRLAQLRVERLS